MPWLDVSEVLLDPQFCDTGLTCTRNTQTVGLNGLAANTPTVTPFYGVVTSDKGDILERMAEGSRVKGSITIHTKFALQDGRSGLDADVVTWQGRKYTVSNVNDYSTYGAGFVDASCDLMPLAGS
jgi:hypothetical protein